MSGLGAHGDGLLVVRAQGSSASEGKQEFGGSTVWVLRQCWNGVQPLVAIRVLGTVGFLKLLV